MCCFCLKSLLHLILTNVPLELISMNNIKDCINEVIKVWNEEVQRQFIQTQNPDLNAEYILNVSVRKKKFYVNRKEFYEKKIAEITLYYKVLEKHKSAFDLMLWRNQKIMPPKVKNAPSHIVEDEYINSLYKQFLYEAIGTFCASTKQYIMSRDAAEYDMENDRLRQHESAVDMVVQVLTDGPFFKKGDEFDVFMVTDEYYAVYTQHDIGLKNNGIARLNIKDCMVTQNAKVKILSL